MSIFDLNGRTALVTGAARGIGRAIAIGLAGAGAQVVLADVLPTSETAAAIGAIGATALEIPLDIRSERDVAAAMETTAATFGRLDILVNNAGIQHEAPLLETTLDDFDRVVAVNFRGAFIVGREAVRLMERDRRGGRIINVASELAYLGRATNSVYCATKGAILSMTRSWAREFAPRILINAIAPGPIDTILLAQHLPDLSGRSHVDDVVLKRIGAPDELVGMAIYLASDASTYVTGQTFGVNGGAVMT